METMVSSNSAAADFAAYWRTRIASCRIAVLVAGLATLVFIADAPVGAGDVLVRATLTALLVVSFRLWDDLADRDFDSVHHVERVLPQSTRPGRFWAALAVAAVVTVGVLSVFEDGTSVAIYGALVGLLGLVYHGPWRLMRERFILVLLKYPAFITMLSPSGTTSSTALCTAAAYLAISFHEWRDDPALREGHGAGRIAVMLVVGLIAAMSLLGVHD
jgi:4-hydroxybenzoate polyprenyltransferase